MTNYPRRVETYRGTEIWFDPVRKKYYASHCEHTKQSENIEEVKQWLREYKL
jgi:hypothetical protein